LRLSRRFAAAHCGIQTIIYNSNCDASQIVAPGSTPMIGRMNKPSLAAARGFTLIELMVTMGIVAILTAIAYPSYRNYVLRGQIIDAQNGLSALRANMERYFQDNRTYVATGTFTPPCSPAFVVGKFTLSCSAAPTATTYTLSAVGSGSTAGFTFTIDQAGNQASTVTGVSGWSASCPTTWVTKAGTC
jgi:prepilin-type N-terminal cleavage/methylation domain-containing protein